MSDSRFRFEFLPNNADHRSDPLVVILKAVGDISETVGTQTVFFSDEKRTQPRIVKDGTSAASLFTCHLHDDQVADSHLLKQLFELKQNCTRGTLKVVVQLDSQISIVVSCADSWLSSMFFGDSSDLSISLEFTIGVVELSNTSIGSAKYYSGFKGYGVEAEPSLKLELQDTECGKKVIGVKPRFLLSSPSVSTGHSLKTNFGIDGDGVEDLERIKFKDIGDSYGVFAGSAWNFIVAEPFIDSATIPSQLDFFGFLDNYFAALSYCPTHYTKAGESESVSKSISTTDFFTESKEGNNPKLPAFDPVSGQSNTIAGFVKPLPSGTNYSATLSSTPTWFHVVTLGFSAVLTGYLEASKGVGRAIRSLMHNVTSDYNTDYKTGGYTSFVDGTQLYPKLVALSAPGAVNTKVGMVQSFRQKIIYKNRVFGIPSFSVVEISLLEFPYNLKRKGNL